MSKHYFKMLTDASIYMGAIKFQEKTIEYRKFNH